MRLYPELVPTLVWTSLHVLMNMLFFLIVCTKVPNCRNSTFRRAKSTLDRHPPFEIQLDNKDT